MNTKTQTEKPVRTGEIEVSADTNQDGDVTNVIVEHFRQSDRFYRITWRDGHEPLVEDEEEPT